MSDEYYIILAIGFMCLIFLSIIVKLIFIIEDLKLQNLILISSIKEINNNG